MRNYYFPVASVLALLIAGSSQAAEKPRTAQGNRNQVKKVWTNDDLDRLRARGLISIVGQEAAPQATPTPVAQGETTFPAYESRLDDPKWYADKASDLQAVLEAREAALREQQTAIALATDQRITDPGLNLGKDNAGVTLAAGTANLQAQVQEAQSQLDELSDLARQHDIPPGVLRS